MTKCQQELSKELIKYQKLCQEAAKSVTTTEITEQLDLITRTIATIQELVKQNIIMPSETDLTAIQDALREFREVAPTEQQIQAVYKNIERLSKPLNTLSYVTPNTELLYWR
jgi:hypothetical protein